MKKKGQRTENERIAKLENRYIILEEDRKEKRAMEEWIVQKSKKGREGKDVRM